MNLVPSPNSENYFILEKTKQFNVILKKKFLNLFISKCFSISHINKNMFKCFNYNSKCVCDIVIKCKIVKINGYKNEVVF